ncbi:peptidase family T4 protein [Drechmeria coniospora]|uniref:Peptidase family T4 protein n=1 Tax=Drechmeria coniospora TaxID=98403 RepID=A0A151GUE7_DRECN|nr:peptidase family T4 protein [Drechmeria coniospora]KYK60642.1 peptidase family T4 protein [Drechmeria coniospora]ODA80798.1 hypothetical protein RJ55_03758 [Drechmeria coniospora]
MKMSTKSSRGRVRHVLPNLYYGRWAAGPLNSITDVPGVLVHTQSIEPDGDVHTGVTTILPRKDWMEYSTFAAVFRFNGCGEMTGSHWLDETGLLCSPIVITATSSVGEGYRGVQEHFYRRRRRSKDEFDGGGVDLFMFPLVAETFDGFLSDPGRFAVTARHVMDGIDKASPDAVPEGNTGGGTGMICHRFKGGTGSSSRTVQGIGVDGGETSFTVGVLVQANYGLAENLRIGGVPVGHVLEREGKLPVERSGARERLKDGSIIVIIATDAPLVPIQLQRLAKRATVGLAKVGGYGANTSGDIFLAFSTGNRIPSQVMTLSGETAVHAEKAQERMVRMTDNDSINGLFEAAADATEEAIYNAMFMAESMTGFKGRRVEALDLDAIKKIVETGLSSGKE